VLELELVLVLDFWRITLTKQFCGIMEVIHSDSLGRHIKSEDGDEFEFEHEETE
jgi:hypothetical protein